MIARRARSTAVLIATAWLAGSTLLPPAAVAQTAGEASVTTVPAADAEVEARLRRVAAELRCLVCQNQTIADSHSGLAQDLRNEARTLMRAGASDDAVRQYMTERYGDFVLYRPPFKPSTWLLWAAPALLVAAGAALLAQTLRRRARLPSAAFEPEPDGLADETFDDHPNPAADRRATTS